MIDKSSRPLPDYYPTMFLDGYEPWEILQAAHRTFLKTAAEAQPPEDYTVNIKSEVKVMK